MPMRISLPTSREEFFVYLVLAILVAVIVRDQLAMVPFAVLVLAPFDVPLARRKVYNSSPGKSVRGLFNALEWSDEGRVVEASIALNLGLLGAFLLWFGTLSEVPLESLTVLLATVPVAYLVARAEEGVGVVLFSPVGIVAIFLALILGHPLAAAGGVPGIAVAQMAHFTKDELREKSAPVFPIGGRGVFGSIYVVVILTVALTAL